MHGGDGFRLGVLVLISEWVGHRVTDEWDSYARRSETRRFREADVRRRKAAVALGLRAFVSLVSLVSAK